MFSWAKVLFLIFLHRSVCTKKLQKSFKKFGEYFFFGGGGGGENCLFLGPVVLDILVLIVKGVCPRLLSLVSLPV